jgi:hypothetical protein
MMNEQEAALKRVEAELRFIAREASSIEGNGGSDFEKVDEICIAVNAALDALFGLRLSLEPACEEIPAGVALPEAA